jgi:hypothetical protein
MMPLEDAKAFAAEFHGAGLVWLVNAAVLHPRGYALAVETDDDGDYTGYFTIVKSPYGEPWYFESGTTAQTVANFEDAEALRSTEVFEALRSMLDK